jgi:hypothetical protein
MYTHLTVRVQGEKLSNGIGAGVFLGVSKNNELLQAAIYL